MQVVVAKLTLLKTKHLSLMILDSSLNVVSMGVHIMQHNVATPIDGSPTIDEEPSLVQKDKRLHK